MPPEPTASLTRQDAAPIPLPLWIVTEHPERCQTQNAALVRAATDQEAAEIGVEALAADYAGREDDFDTDSVIVWEVTDRRAFAISLRAEAELVPDEFQCCGGAGTQGGHSGWCQEHTHV